MGFYLLSKRSIYKCSISRWKDTFIKLKMVNVNHFDRAFGIFLNSIRDISNLFDHFVGPCAA